MEEDLAMTRKSRCNLQPYEREFLSDSQIGQEQLKCTSRSGYTDGFPGGTQRENALLACLVGGGEGGWKELAQEPASREPEFDVEKAEWIPLPEDEEDGGTGGSERRGTGRSVPQISPVSY
uniref:ELM2 domain-containing protein n=1 Tax=Setaria digitata TaxID=48799 RepID=A0A915Q170_9BILA